MLLTLIIVMAVVIAAAVIEVFILDRRNERSAEMVASLGRELTVRGKDIQTLLIEQNKHRSLIRIGEADRTDMLEACTLLEKELIYERNREKIYLERVSEFHAVMNDGGLRAIFRMLKAGGMDPRGAVEKFEREDGPFTASEIEMRAFTDLRKPAWRPVIERRAR